MIYLQKKAKGGNEEKCADVTFLFLRCGNGGMAVVVNG